jgi:hypothetical protein
MVSHDDAQDGETTEAPPARQSNGEEVQAQQPPFEEGLDFTLQVPVIEAKMVNADVLSDYEIWFFSASLAFSSVVGFLVAYLQSLEDETPGVTSYLIVTVVFAVLFLVFLARTIVLRVRIRREVRTYPMRATGVPNPER